MNVLKEIEFALKNGHTEVKVGTENDGTPFVMGTFGYIATSNKAEYEAMISLINSYIGVTLEEKLTELFGSKWIVKNNKITQVLSNKLKSVEVIKRNGSKIYLFKVEGFETAYRLSATQMVNGKWWLKEGRCDY